MQTVFDNTKERMEKTISNLKHEFGSIRAGRANASVLDKVSVDYYGTPTPINQLASVSIAEARILVIQPWDASVLNAISKAIQASDIGINPTNDGKVIRLVFPQLTEDRRKEIVKSVQKVAEEAKVAVRSIRRDAIDKLKKMEKNSEITEDDLSDGEKEVQKITDDFIKKVDDETKLKEKEV
ncbi:MAG: ribosome recycling factor, partial [Clostridia bacterium]|nr:ribosome recycling factor [Clostridia bacterium]